MNRRRQWMQEAIRLGVEGMQRGEGGPFGALVIQNGAVLGRGWNRVLATNDPTAHAEIVAIRQACAGAGTYWLEDCEIVVNCEPCPMCLAAIYWARIPALTYGASRFDAAGIGFDDEHIYAQLALEPADRTLRVRQVDRETAAHAMRRWRTLQGARPY